MNYRCPNCQSSKIMPVANANTARPIVPKSLVVLIPSILILLLFVFISIIMLVIGKKTGTFIQTATILSVSVR